MEQTRKQQLLETLKATIIELQDLLNPDAGEGIIFAIQYEKEPKELGEFIVNVLTAGMGGHLIELTLKYFEENPMLKEVIEAALDDNLFKKIYRRSILLKKEIEYKKGRPEYAHIDFDILPNSYKPMTEISNRLSK